MYVYINIYTCETAKNTHMINSIMFYVLEVTNCFFGGGVLAGYMRGWGEIQGAVRYPASGWLGVCGGSRSYRYVCVYIYYIIHIHIIYIYYIYTCMYTIWIKLENKRSSKKKYFD